MVGFLKPHLSVNTEEQNTTSNYDYSSPTKDRYTTEQGDGTPRTNASTPSTVGDRDADLQVDEKELRNQSDLRSPGMASTPAAASSSAAVPNFMTQTDKYGNPIVHAPPSASTSPAIQTAGTDETEHESEVEPVDACDTLLESLRMMCCCILPDPADTNTVVVEKKKNARLRPNNNNLNHLPQQQLQQQNSQKTTITAHQQAGPDGSYRGPLISHRYVQGSSTAVHPEKQIMKEDSDMGGIKLLRDLDADPTSPTSDIGKKCLVLDLDETLVHSSFRAVPGADFVIPVQIEEVVHFVYVMKRPGVDEFLIEMAKHYEIVIYTASLNKYADPLLDLLDPLKTIRYRLFRESCVYYEGSYVKDLSLLNRDLTQTIIVDNSPASYIFHPENSIDCSSFIDDPNDRELHQIGSFLTGIRQIKDVRGMSNMWRDWPRVPRVDFVSYPDGYDPDARDSHTNSLVSYHEYENDTDPRRESEPLHV